jgi:DNA-binding transcriptional regulator YhcF (GntR family)
MTKNSDEMAFEEWVASEDTREKDGREGYFANNNNFTRDYWIAEKAWQAATEHERKRSEKLKETLEYIYKTECAGCNLQEVLTACKKALQEYQGGEEND